MTGTSAEEMDATDDIPVDEVVVVVVVVRGGALSSMLSPMLRLVPELSLFL